MSTAELEHLIQHSRISNAEHGITGILLHVRDTFFQILEGPQTEIDRLYAKICMDRRHTRITKIIYEPIPRRYFADSRMTLATISPEELRAILGENSPEVRASLLDGLDEGRSKRLLQAFTDGRWRHSTATAPSPMAVPA